MTPPIALAVLAVLAACTPSPPAGTAQARCEQQADNDPTVSALFLEQATRRGDPELQQQLTLARRKAVNTCLAAAGVATRGGVEPVTRARYGLGLY